MTQLAHTCDLSHGVEDLQLLWVERRHFVVVVAVERGRKRRRLSDLWRKVSSHRAKEMSLPVDARQEEVQTALNLGTVYETVDVASVYSLSAETPSPETSWETTEKKGENKKTQYELT